MSLKKHGSPGSSLKHDDDTAATMQKPSRESFEDHLLQAGIETMVIALFLVWTPESLYGVDLHLGHLSWLKGKNFGLRRLILTNASDANNERLGACLLETLAQML